MTATKKITALARSRVTVKEDKNQSAAARMFIDYTGGGDSVTVYVNPDIAPTEAYEGYALRGAIMAALEGFRRYNRGQTRRHGTRADEQRQFDAAYNKALSELEELIHLTPTQSAFAPANVDAPSNETHREALLDYSFPHFRAIFPLGLSTVQAVNDAPDDLLLSVLTPPQVIQVRKATRRALGLPPLSEMAVVVSPGAAPAPETPPAPAESAESAPSPEPQAAESAPAAPMTLSAPAVTAAAAPVSPAPEVTPDGTAAGDVTPAQANAGSRKRRGG